MMKREQIHVNEKCVLYSPDGSPLERFCYHYIFIVQGPQGPQPQITNCRFSVHIFVCTVLE